MGSSPAARSNPSRTGKRGDAMDGGNPPSRSAKKSSALLPKGWSGTASYRCSPHLIPRIVGLLSEEQKGFVRKIGFGSLLSMADFEINKALTLWLVGRFSCETEALEFEGGVSIPVRPLVKSVLGIPSGPIPVVQSPYSHFSSTKVRKAKELAEEMCGITEEEPFCTAFMMVILAIYLAPNTTMLVNRSLLGAAQKVGSLRQMDWCGFVADYLIKGLMEFKESDAPFVLLKGCVHILSVIFIDLVKHAAFEVPNGFPRLGFVTTEHNKWVASHPFGSLLVRRLEESVYAPVLNNGNGNIVQVGECADSDTDTDALSNQSATDNDQNNQHPVSPGPGSLLIVTGLETSARSAEHIIFPRSGEQLQSAGPSSEPFSAQILNGLEVLAAAAESRNQDSPSTMEKHDRSAKRARVELPNNGQMVRDGEATIRMDMSLFSCRVCSHPVKPPVFQCNVGHLACGRCLAELPDEQCQMCEHGGDFSRCPVMDDVVLSSTMKCSHDGCHIYVPYHELDDHQSTCPHGPCFCTETGCSFAGAPAALLGHLAALHSVPVHKVHYGSVHQLRVSEPRFLLHAEEDDSAFLLAVGVLGMATVVSVVCLRAGAYPEPRYAVKLWANGPPLPSSAAGSILLDMQAVTSISRPGEVAVEELPSFLMVPPAYLVDCGAYKEVSLDVRIDRM
uniref:RING-type E3 ubiquitin transferase n=1 Tax=Aegilops tauschii subsp. strangulata TaxID=200361 RepID=A0A453DQD8_AEGTS